MALKIPQNEEISEKGKNGVTERVSSAAHQKKANRESINVKTKQSKVV